MTTLDKILDPLDKLTKDLKDAAITLSDHEARFLVDYYYIIQEDRTRAYSQERALEKPVNPKDKVEPHELITWLAVNNRRLENNTKAALQSYAEGQRVCRWAMSIIGIGPVIAAGMKAHIDITRSPGVSNLWSFAGLSPESKWEKGQKRPWNAALKVLAWKAGESFVKTSNHKDSFYGPLYREWKDDEIRRNEDREFAEQAERVLDAKKIGKSTDAYKNYSVGKLPPAHIHARARRKVMKLFLSHWWEVAYECEYGKPPEVKPYVIDHLGHKDYIPAPGWPM